MEDELQSGGGGGGGDSSRTASSFMKKGDRQLFTVDLRPGETTIVSWKKLVKDANKLKGPSVQPENPDPAPNPILESRLAPVFILNFVTLYVNACDLRCILV